METANYSWVGGGNFPQGTKLYFDLIPLINVCSFGVSWLSEKLTNRFVSKLESLQAIIFGLGKANCNSVYPCMFLKDKQ